MTSKQMIELIQQHHPHIDETEAIMLLNEAKDEFCENTGIAKGYTNVFTSVAGQLIYDFDLGPETSNGDALKVINVWVGDEGKGVLASRLSGTLNIRDDS
tara:strand:- start:1815 stop:2114 length:300 start_codon:yes stop_codon:yes gene_type:complete